MLPDKYVVAQNQIRLGHAADAAHGIEALLGVGDDQVGEFKQQRERAIQLEFETHSSPDVLDV